MKVVRSVEELREEVRAARAARRRIGLVPTMGAFHEGHVSLMKRARLDCDLVVVSLFVNPTQFNDPRDLERYPRDETRDRDMASDAGVDVLFAPDVAAVYPGGFATTVEVRGLTDVLEGAIRGPGHFRGVTTVVAKLFGMAQPDFAYFGQKDAQQALVVRRMVRDLDVPVTVVVCPTVREADGLAMSSRNQLLDPAARQRAVALSRGLFAAERAAGAGERSTARLIEVAKIELLDAGVETEYLDIVSPDTLQSLDVLAGDALMAVAARVGTVRLIDNVILHPA